MLPEEISTKVLQILGLPDLCQNTKPHYAERLQVLRQQMRKLAADFAADAPTEKHYTDAYLAYNFPMNLVKTMIVTKEIALRYPDILGRRARLHVLDIGCGDGAGIYGFYYALKDAHFIREFNLMGIDTVAKMLERARILGRWLIRQDARVKVFFRRQIIKDLSLLNYRKRYNIILCINSLAEIVKSEKIPVWFIHSLLKRLTDDGLLVIIEPALKKFVRRLMRLRDGLVSQRKGIVLLPCLHDNPCALMLVDARKEWCHQSVHWSPPDFLNIINEGLNREIDVLKFAYLVIAKNKVLYDRPRGYRVISQLLKEKGKARCFICTSQGRVELTRLSKSMTADNADFDLMCKGDILQLRNIVAKKRHNWYITQKTGVKVLK